MKAESIRFVHQLLPDGGGDPAPGDRRLDGARSSPIPTCYRWRRASPTTRSFRASRWRPDIARELCRGVEGDEPLQYGSNQGRQRLREFDLRVACRVTPASGREAFCPERVAITNGSPSRRSTSPSKCFCEPGDIVLVEQPSYFVMSGNVQGLGYPRGRPALRARRSGSDRGDRHRPGGARRGGRAGAGEGALSGQLLR